MFQFGIWIFRFGACGPKQARLTRTNCQWKLPRLSSCFLWEARPCQKWRHFDSSKQAPDTTLSLLALATSVADTLRRVWLKEPCHDMDYVIYENFDGHRSGSDAFFPVIIYCYGSLVLLIMWHKNFTSNKQLFVILWKVHRERVVFKLNNRRVTIISKYVASLVRAWVFVEMKLFSKINLSEECCT